MLKKRSKKISEAMVAFVRSQLNSPLVIGMLCKEYNENGNLTSYHKTIGSDIRNVLKKSGICKGWAAEDYDNMWQPITLKAIYHFYKN